MKTSLVVLAAHSSWVRLMGTKSGWPLKTISSAGTWLVKIAGTPLASMGFGLALGPPLSRSTSPFFDRSVAMSFITPSSIGPALDSVHGPVIVLASSQPS